MGFSPAIHKLAQNFSNASVWEKRDVVDFGSEVDRSDFGFVALFRSDHRAERFGPFPGELKLKDALTRGHY